MGLTVTDTLPWLLTLTCAVVAGVLFWRCQRMTTTLAELSANLEDQYQTSMDYQRLAAAVEHAAEAVAITDCQGVYEYVNPAFEKITGYPASEALGNTLFLLDSDSLDPQFYQHLWETLLVGETWSGRLTQHHKDGTAYVADQTLSPIRDPHSGMITNVVILKRDVTEHLQLERQLQHGQKLEAIGRLASGIAHEINTPTQYISDNMVFLKRAFTSLIEIIEKIPNLLHQARHGTSNTEQLGELEAAMASTKLDFLLREVPDALAQSMDGLERVSNIVSAMKEFAHPVTEMTSIDLNHAIQSTTTVARNEWKYVCELELNLDPDLPPLTCLPGEINQVVLIMIVNAAHAIADAVKVQNIEKGLLSFSTRRCGEQVEIVIADTGIGMTDKVKARIFEAFFTTKEVGRGTGQGLNIAWDVVVNKHQGTIDVESQPGSGTRFIIRLPLAGNRDIPQQAAA